MSARSRTATMLLILGLGLAACGDAADDADGSDDSGETQETTGEPETDAAETPDAAVGVSETDAGEILVDADGRTLYVFDRDEQGESTCRDDCAETWPPLLGEEPTAAEGADESLLGTTTREDGADQVTYNEWPLYHWAGDDERGDVGGQGIDGAWWTIDARGEPQRDASDDDDGGDDGSGTTGY